MGDRPLDVGFSSKYEARIRPRLLTELIGRQSLVNRLSIAVEYTRKTGELVPHLLIHGPGGSGKGLLAAVLANELGYKVQQADGADSRKCGDLLPYLTSLDVGDILYVRDIDRSSRSVLDFLRTAISMFTAEIVLGEGLNVRTIRMPIKRFTLVATTTRLDRLPPRLVEAFGLVERFDPFTPSELTDLVTTNAGKLGRRISPDAAAAIAAGSKGDASAANSWLTWAHDRAVNQGDGSISLADVRAVGASRCEPIPPSPPLTVRPVADHRPAAVTTPAEPLRPPVSESRQAALREATADLHRMIGLAGVKREVEKLTAWLTVQAERRALGLKDGRQALHFVFTGNPGTGKTTVARILAKVLYGLGLLERPTVTETDRAGLVGGYLGQTALKTDEVVQKAVGGVLFVDEAYALAGDPARYAFGDMYGDEAVNALLKRMEDHRDRLCVIAAGYPDPMARFLASNPGLESRFTRFIRFDDYTGPDLCRIFGALCDQEQYTLTPLGSAYAAVLFALAARQRGERFGNGRYVRNVFEEVVGRHAERVARLPRGGADADRLTRLTDADLLTGPLAGVGAGGLDVPALRWAAACPACGTRYTAHFRHLREATPCRNCTTPVRVDWAELVPETICVRDGRPGPPPAE